MKYQDSKKGYQKVLNQLEESEMERKRLQQNCYDMVKKIHKLKKDKRALQEECARNFGGHSPRN